MRCFFKTIRPFPILALLILCLLLPSAQSWAAAGNSPAWPHEKSDLAPDPALVFGKLNNGFGYVLMKNTEPRDRVSVKFVVRAGSLNEQDDQQGLAHYLEHMAFNGSEHFPPGELIKYFQSIGMKFGNDVNAQTGFEETIYQLLLPNGLRESLGQGLTVMADYAYGLFLLPGEVDRERGVILAEKQTRDSVGYRTFVKSLGFFVNGALVSRRMPIGEEEVIKAADHAGLKKFYDDWYRPDNAFLVMAGDFDPQEAEPIIKEKFAHFASRAKEPQAPLQEKVVHKGVKTFYHYEPEAGNTDVSLETLVTVKPEPDSFALESRRILESMANAIVKHRLEALKESPDCPFSEASVGSGDFLEHYAYSSISATCAPENWSKSLALVEQTLRQALKYGFTEEETSRVRKEFQAGMEKAVAQAATRNSEALARAIVRNVVADEVLQSPAQELDLFGPVVAKATPRSLHKAFKKTWPKSHRLVLVTGNAALQQEGATPEAVIAGAYKESSNKKVAKPSDGQARTFPYLPGPIKPGAVAERKTIEDLGVVQVRFENGARLNIKKTDFKDSEILASLRLGSGRSGEPEDKPGLALLAPAVINESGLGGLSAEELKRALAGRSTGVGLAVGEDAFFLNGSTIPKELPLLFQLLHAWLLDPGFREDAFTRSMERFSQMYEELGHTVEGAVQMEALPFLAGGDSRFGNPPWEKFSALTLEDAAAWAGTAIRTEPIELTLVGDLDVERAVELAALYLGGLEPRTGPSPERDGAITFPRGQSRRFEVDTKIDKALVLAAFPTADIWDISRTRRLNVMADVLSDRLLEDIREKLGLTYSPRAWNHPFRAYPGYGYLIAHVSVDPGAVDKVLGLILDIAQDLAANGPTQDELQRALEPTVTGIKDMLRTNAYWMNTVLSGSSIHPQQLEWCRTILQDYASVTAEDVARYARRYLEKDAAAVAAMAPK